MDADDDARYVDWQSRLRDDDVTWLVKPENGGFKEDLGNRDGLPAAGPAKGCGAPDARFWLTFSTAILEALPAARSFGVIRLPSPSLC